MLEFLAAIQWNVDPEIWSWKFIHLRWYGLLFASGFVVGYFIFSKIYKIENKPQEDLEVLLTYMVVATVIGSRLGHVLFYDLDRYMANPIEIFKIWEGGLASHGGTIGLLIALFLYSKKKPDQPYLWLLDRIVIPIALAGAFIRLGNLMNSEIYGHATDVPWAFVFVRDDESMLPRHPTQLYEAGSYILIFIYLLFSYLRTKQITPRGRILGQFLILLFGARLLIEFVKNDQKEFEADMFLNMGQLLSIPFVVAGIILLVNSFSEKAKQEAITFAANGNTIPKEKKHDAK